MISYEHPSRLRAGSGLHHQVGRHPAAPGQARVITFGDGPPSEFYYNGKTMMAFAPGENLVAVADGHPRSTPRRHGVRYCRHLLPVYRPDRGRSVQGHRGRTGARLLHRAVERGGRHDDRHGGVCVERRVRAAWIGAEDKLPRLVRAVYRTIRRSFATRWSFPLAARPGGRDRVLESAKAASADALHSRPEKPSGYKAPPKTKPGKSRQPRPHEEAHHEQDRYRRAGLLIVLLAPGRAAAWAHANRYGGSTEHAYGEGTEHTSADGTSTAHAWGGGTEHTNVYAAPRPASMGKAPITPVPMARPPTIRPGTAAPTTIPRLTTRITRWSRCPPYSTGCYGCAAAAGAVVGMAAGAAIVSSNTAAATSSADWRGRRRQREHGGRRQRRRCGGRCQRQLLRDGRELRDAAARRHVHQPGWHHLLL